jgi:trimethylamine--corrinoid protein Co-methyltransferase
VPVNFEPSIRLTVLPEDSIRAIHNSALEVLESTGVAINTEEGRNIMVDGGCKLRGNNEVLIPSGLVEKALTTVPSSITLYDRLGNPRCVLEGWKTSFGTGSDCPFILDMETDEKRKCTYEDVAGGALICDALKNIDFVMPVGIVSNRDAGSADVYAVLATMLNTVKPVVFTAHNKRNFQTSLKLAAAVSGGMQKLQEKPTVCLYAEPTSPLKHMPEATDKLIHASRMRIPVVFTPCPLGGATAPATAAGILTQAVAECLSGIVLHQLVNPGAPIIFGGVLYMMDMSTTITPYGSPELHQLCAALTDISRYLNLPMFGTCGCSDSKRVDAQAGMEVGFSVLMSSLTGQNLTHDIGFLESALITSYEMYILSDEAIGMAKHIAGGITVTYETLATDIIAEVGHKSNFLDHEHTLKFFRKELFFPGIMDRNNYTQWENRGSKTMDARLKEMAAEILNSHKPEPVGKAVLKQLENIIGD